MTTSSAAAFGFMSAVAGMFVWFLLSTAWRAHKQRPNMPVGKEPGDYDEPSSQPPMVTCPGRGEEREERCINPVPDGLMCVPGKHAFSVGAR